MTEIKSEILRKGLWMYRVQYWIARQKGIPQNFDGKEYARLGIVVQLAVADELGYHTIINMGGSDNGLDIQEGDYFIDIKSQKNIVDGTYRLWNQHSGKVTNIMIFVQGNRKEFKILGWNTYDVVMDVPICGDFRPIPLESMRHIHELKAYLYISKLKRTAI